MTQLTEEQIEKIEEAKKEYLDKADELWETLSRSEFFERRQKIWKEYIKKRDEIMNETMTEEGYAICFHMNYTSDECENCENKEVCDENYNRNANKEEYL